MERKIDQIFIDYIFSCIQANHHDHGYMFKGDNAMDVANAWKDMLYQQLLDKNIMDIKLITKKAYEFKVHDKPFPDVTDFIMYILDIPMPSKSWLKSVILQIQNNEKYNRTSPVKCHHRNNSAPVIHWEIAENLARCINEDFGSTLSIENSDQMLNTAINTMVFKKNNLNSLPESELKFSEIKELSNKSATKRNEALKEMLQKLGKKTNP